MTKRSCTCCSVFISSSPCCHMCNDAASSMDLTTVTTPSTGAAAAVPASSNTFVVDNFPCFESVFEATCTAGRVSTGA